MTIHVEKLSEHNFPEPDVPYNVVHESEYKIELTAIELDYIRHCLKYAAENMNKWTHADHVTFADKCATIINNVLVANGD
jgi:hypothetical protein